MSGDKLEPVAAPVDDRERNTKPVVFSEMAFGETQPPPATDSAGLVERLEACPVGRDESPFAPTTYVIPESLRDAILAALRGEHKEPKP